MSTARPSGDNELIVGERMETEPVARPSVGSQAPNHKICLSIHPEHMHTALPRGVCTHAHVQLQRRVA